MTLSIKAPLPATSPPTQSASHFFSRTRSWLRSYLSVYGTSWSRAPPVPSCGSRSGWSVIQCWRTRSRTCPGETWRPHPFQYVYFSTRDLGALRERCLSAGATAVTPVEHMPWGETLFYAVDPFGNPIAFVESGTEFLGGRPAP
ncbi:VOC family protein [Myxococcus sp. AM009]|uniref:VOC family protein n=1 Tax=Myxococcus sp. AM009 TaxID=2745137 RepID=UPI0034D2A3A0